VFQDRIGAQTSGNNLVIWMDSFPDVIIPIGKSNIGQRPGSDDIVSLTLSSVQRLTVQPVGRC
jgi:hypothetical protein